MSKVFVSDKAVRPLKEYLTSRFEVVFTKGEGSFVDARIKTHTDLYMCQFGLGKAAEIFSGGRSVPEATYPGDAVYNAVATGKYFVHNTGITDVDLLSRAMSKSLNVVFVRQGYTRCNCLPVTDDSFITSDEGICKALAEEGAEVLLIENGHVILPGFPYGFIGGCAGNLRLDGEPALIFNGDLSAHSDYEKIAAFAKDRDVKLVFFEGYPLDDIGSILFSYR